jgi:hypothetical protein
MLIVGKERNITQTSCHLYQMVRSCIHSRNRLQISEQSSRLHNISHDEEGGKKGHFSVG